VPPIHDRHPIHDPSLGAAQRSMKSVTKVLFVNEMARDQMNQMRLLAFPEHKKSTQSSNQPQSRKDFDELTGDEITTALNAHFISCFSGKLGFGVTVPSDF
jgi:ABC-type Fe2+-enterobactin transport system substrate-binding protein